MNYIKHLSGFFSRTTVDNSLTPTHISMYMALFQFWNANRFQNPVTISRSEVMSVAKINSVATYHKCMKDLHNLSYIIYEPSYNPFCGSRVFMVEYETASANKKLFKKQTAACSLTSSKACSVTTAKNSQQLDSYRSDTPLKNSQLNDPYINSINNTNSKTYNACVVKNKPEEFLLEKIDQKTEKKELENETKIAALSKPKEKSSAKKEKVTVAGENIPPTLHEVRLHFSEKEALPHEADKFYNHYESNGWLVGGRSKMKNWHAAARNWQLNSKKFSRNTTRSTTPRPNNLNATTHKSYREEL